MDAYGCFGALSCAFHRAQVIRPASVRRDHERMADAERKKLGSLGLFRTVGDKQSVIERLPGHFLKRHWDMFALIRAVRVVYVTRGGDKKARLPVGTCQRWHQLRGLYLSLQSRLHSPGGIGFGSTHSPPPRLSRLSF